MYSEKQGVDGMYFEKITANQYREQYCGKVTEKQVDKELTVAGWIESKRDHGQLLFISLRDGSGLLQCVFEVGSEAFKIADQASRESVLQVTGKLVMRTPETYNDDLPTGRIELQATVCKLLSKAKPIPFDNSQAISEEMKLRYRYLYLRRPAMQEKLKLRAEVIHYLRNAMRDQGFLEVQTPILTASSPEGARDYLVPSFLHKGKFYALPQAPQQFKQILMASGLNKYFQIAPCFRAEASRADRSPGEFYQLDFEISFATQEIVFDAIEPVIYGLFKKFYHGKVSDSPFPIIKYRDSLEMYCSDKPDLRNPLTYVDITKALQATPPQLLETLVKSKDFCAKVIAVPGAHVKSRKNFEDLQVFAQSEGMGGLAYAKKEGDTWSGPGAKMIPLDVLEKVLKDKDDAMQDGVVFLLAGRKSLVQKVGGVLRNKLYYDLMENAAKEEMNFCWIVDFPMYEYDEAERKVIFSHNPFSMPQGGLEALKNKDPLEIDAWQYDLVCNGIELCSGAIRNHDPELMKEAFQIAGYTEEETRNMFGAMVNAFECGVPPHGGAAPGIDRMIMLLAGEDNIREIIAFPLSQNAQDLMMNAPTPATAAQLKELGLQVVEKTLE